MADEDPAPGEGDAMGEGEQIEGEQLEGEFFGMPLKIIS